MSGQIALNTKRFSSYLNDIPFFSFSLSNEANNPLLLQKTNYSIRETFSTLPKEGKKRGTPSRVDRQREMSRNRDELHRVFHVELSKSGIH